MTERYCFLLPKAASFPRLLLEFVINLTNDISTSPVKLNGMKIPHLWNTPRQVRPGELVKTTLAEGIFNVSESNQGRVLV